jgi:photosystem II stability/assembly factor-like uncharacterized protein
VRDVTSSLPRSGLLRVAALSLLAAAAFAPGPVLGLDEAAVTSETMPLAAHSLLLDVARAGSRLVAVGERGHVLLSDDEGASWRQVVVPTRTTLTAVLFADASLGWAVGHEAVILRTEDGGESWSLVHAMAGADLPLLDVWFESHARGIAVGAYGTLLRSDDGGRTWTEARLRLVDHDDADARDDDDAFDDGFEPTDVHLNRLAAAPDGALYAAGEAGHLFRSDDRGASWATLASPYEGSFFGLRAGPGGTLVAVGLRGHAYRSSDRGASWVEVQSDTDALLTGIVQLADGRLVVHGLAGTLLISDDDGATVRRIELPGREGIAAALPLRDSGLLLVGDFGTLRLGPRFAPRPPVD